MTLAFVVAIGIGYISGLVCGWLLWGGPRPPVMGDLMAQALGHDPANLTGTHVMAPRWATHCRCGHGFVDHWRGTGNCMVPPPDTAWGCPCSEFVADDPAQQDESAGS